MTIEQTRAYMTVKSAPLLQNEQVCDFLETMNQEEIVSTAQEEEPLNTHLSELDKAYSWTVIIGDGVCAALGMGSAISTVKYTYDHSSYAKLTDVGYSVDDAYRSGWKSDLSSEEKQKCIEIAKKTSERNYIKREEERIKDEDRNTRKWFLFSALVSGCFAVVADLSAYQDKKIELITHYTSLINDDRHLRLQQRIRQSGKS